MPVAAPAAIATCAVTDVAVERIFETVMPSAGEKSMLVTPARSCPVMVKAEIVCPAAPLAGATDTMRGTGTGTAPPMRAVTTLAALPSTVSAMFTSPRPIEIAECAG